MPNFSQASGNDSFQPHTSFFQSKVNSGSGCGGGHLMRSIETF
jgi:hypothetical protein